LEAVGRAGMALAFAAPELRNDREAFMAFMEISGIFHGNFLVEKGSMWASQFVGNPFGDVCNPTGL